MKIPELGSHVEYFRNEPKVAGEVRSVILDSGPLPMGSAPQIVRVKHDAIVTGYERPADHDPETDGLPTINLVYVEPSDVAAFQGVNWTDGFERAFSVPHEGVDNTGHHFYKDASAEHDKAIKDMVAGIGILKKQLAEKTEEIANLKAEPSATDLDSIAAEDAARAATDGKPTLVKGKPKKE